MLRACERVLKPGGLISFLVIAVGDGLSDDETITAVNAGPDHVLAGPGYSALMAMAGFEAAEVTDVTNEYVKTLEDWIRAWNTESTELKRLVGSDQFAERQTYRQTALEAAGRGILRRHVISGKRP